ncbi:MAG: D-sedoheptulose-7-phosphate isomerase [Asticcacaulis sp.]
MDASSIDAYKSGYADSLKTTLEAIDSDAVQKAADAISNAAKAGNRIYVAGNGGSAAIAEHLCCDWTKGTHCEGHPTIASHSLTSNVALYSAIANDYGFERVFSTQVGFFGKPGDVLIAISSSGNSPNILQAVEAAKAMGMYVVGFSGFKGGKLADICDASIYAAIDNYGVVEDAHQAVMHIIAQYVAYHRDHSHK